MKNFLLIILVILSCPVYSQELNCQVQVVSTQITGTEKRVFETLQTSIYEFMNNRKWTTDNFRQEERIDCSILINMTSRLSTDEFKATIQIQSRRPVYKTSYNSVLLNYNDDDFQFRYLENQPLDFAENTNISNLTSVLAYYAYMVIGLDYDTFAPNGGTVYLQKALNVVQSAQGSDSPGWKAFDGDQNRYWLINNMLDATYTPLRDCMYSYHRLGLDIMADDKEAGRTVILESLLALRKIHQMRALTFNMQVFFNAKADEIINIFSGAFPDEKTKAVNLLNEIDPTKSNKYQKILTSQ